MKKKTIFLSFFFSTFLIFSQAHSEECDLEFDIGENFSNVTKILGEPDVEKNIELLENDLGAESLNYGFVVTKFDVFLL